ncbi:unnamed protein product [Linum tenue]|uniref:AT-hook motif nuclear-localized protein n=1 Tax=Linum tenue TaxID=586396 RepID=A0AAV0PLC4_9ROSI|nr:unnamed protein product [Linum tenue]
MDSREPPSQQQQLPPPHLQQHHHHHQQLHHLHQQQQAAAANMMLGPNPSSYQTMINPNSAAAGFPFNSMPVRPPPPPPPPQSKPPSSSDGGLNAGSFDGSSPTSSGMRFSIEPAKKKRGRPRKYTPDGNIALGLTPTPISSSAASVGHVESGGGAGTPPGLSSSDGPAKRHRGRPPGSVKRQLDALGGVGGIGFTPHVILVQAGEDIASKIYSFSQQGPRTVCILSANGAICNVTLRQPAVTGGTVTYEGRFEIISLSGSFWLSENNGNRSRHGDLSVSLAGSDGRVLGGGVAGMLMAATPVQVIVGSFVAEGKRSTPEESKSGPSLAPTSQMLNFGAPMSESSPPFQGGSSESSDDHGSSPLNRGGPGMYGNAGQSLHSMQMYQVLAGQNPQ